MKKIVLGTLVVACSLMANGSALYDAQCSSCHGAKGDETLGGNPIIVGLGEAKLVTILKGYKGGSLKGDTMNGIASGLSDDDIKNLAKYISTFKK